MEKNGETTYTVLVQFEGVENEIQKHSPNIIQDKFVIKFI